MRGEVLVPCVVAMLLMALMPGATALHAGGDGSTYVLTGTVFDFELDLPRGRIYLSDAPLFGEDPDGLVVVDLESHKETARLSISDARGLAMSPSGRRLAMGSVYGSLYLVNLETLEVEGVINLLESDSQAAYLWDLAFDGENRLIVSLGSQQVSCDGGILVIDLQSLSEESRISGGGCDIETYAGVRVDSPGRRLYVLQWARVLVYDLNSSPPARVGEYGNVSFTPQAALTPDGRHLYFSSGKVYDAPYLSPSADAGRQGDVFLDTAGGYAYYHGGGPFVDRVRLSDHTLEARFAFGRGYPGGQGAMRSVGVDTDRGIAYVLAPIADNANELHAVPTVPAIVNPFPPDGARFEDEVVNGVSATLSGIDPLSVRMEVDGELVSHEYNSEASLVWYAPPSLWGRGSYSVRVTGQDGQGANHELSWTFSIGPPLLPSWDLRPIALGVVVLGAATAVLVSWLYKRGGRPRAPPP